MGVYFTDRFSLLHLATGIVAFYWGISFTAWFVAHAAFELIENTDHGMRVIRLIKLWPGGKSRADSILNSTGDQFYSCVGWGLAYYSSKLF
jgi:hypothetical protein